MTIDLKTPNIPISAASWAPDSRSFVTASFDKELTLCHWRAWGPQSEAKLHGWDGGYRAQDCAISPDGERLVVIDAEKHLFVYNFHTYEKEYQRTFPCKSTSVTISRDSKFMLVSLISGEVQLLDIGTASVVRRFEGQKQGNFIIRSSFGGAAENFVLSGSEGKRFHPTQE